MIVRKNEKFCTYCSKNYAVGPRCLDINSDGIEVDVAATIEGEVNCSYFRD